VICAISALGVSFYTCSDQDLQTAAGVLKAIDLDIRDRAAAAEAAPEDAR
jgi:hypothetical protein